jgi:hypothetical protein
VTGPQGPHDEDDRRTLTNLLAAIAMLLVAIAAICRTRVLDEQRRNLVACVEAGRRDCLRRVDADME